MRFKTMLSLTAYAVLLAAGPAVGQEPAGDADDAAKRQLSEKKDAVECKRIRVTGSHFPQRVCQRASAWAELRQQSQETMRDLTDGPYGAGSNN